MSTYMLASSGNWFLDAEQGLGAGTFTQQAIERARTASAAQLPAPPSRTVTAALVPLNPRLVREAAVSALAPTRILPTTRVVPPATRLLPQVRVAAAAVSNARPVTRSTLLTERRVPITVPPALTSAAAFRERRRLALEKRYGATMPSGASAPVQVAPIERTALAPVPAPSGVLPQSSPFSLVPSASAGGSAPASAPEPMPEGDASAAEVAKLEKELAPAGGTAAAAKIPVVLYIGGALALLWLLGRGTTARSRGGFHGGKAGW